MRCVSLMGQNYGQHYSLTFSVIELIMIINTMIYLASSGLLDPHWIEQRNRQLAEKQAHESVFAPGVAIEESLKHLAERRTDIFGEGDVETQIGKKVSWCIKQE